MAYGFGTERGVRAGAGLSVAIVRRPVVRRDYNGKAEGSIFLSRILGNGSWNHPSFCKHRQLTNTLLKARFPVRL